MKVQEINKDEEKLVTDGENLARYEKSKKKENRTIYCLIIAIVLLGICYGLIWFLKNFL